MRRRSADSICLLSVVAVCVCTLSFLGCSQSSQRERVIPLKASASMNNARSILENYAKGAPITSEADSFDAVVAGVRKEDPKAADTLEKAFQDIRQNPGNRARIAKETLKELPARSEPETPAEDAPPAE